MKLTRSVLAGVGLLATIVLAHAASVPLLSGPMDPGNQQGNINQAIAAVNAAVPGFGVLIQKNYIDNGGMFIAQRGTGATAGASTAGCVAASYSADRWCVDTNVSSGAGYSQVAAVSPALPGFKNMLKAYRNSGALTQKICLMQEIVSSRVIQLQGKPVIFSAYAQGLAGNTATAALSISLITGTGTDEGLGALRSAVGMTASPAVTPAFTGVATNAFAAATTSPTWVMGTGATWSRIYSQPLTVPTTATEAALLICNTPVGSSSGATDGIAVTGVQLEVADPNQTTPSAFVFNSYPRDVQDAQTYYYQYVETNGGYFCPGEVTATNVQDVVCTLPVPMQAAPVMAFTAGGFKYSGQGTPVAVSSPALSANSEANHQIVTITDAATMTAGFPAMLVGTNTTGKITFSADF